MKSILNTINSTESEPAVKDRFTELMDSENKLYLPKILDGHENEEFYSPTFGRLIYSYTDDNSMKFLCVNNGNETLGFFTDGCYYSGGKPTIYPSKELYEQFPLNAYNAWRKWCNNQIQNHILEIEISSWCNGENGRENTEYLGQHWIKFNSKKELTEVKNKIFDILNNVNKI